MFEPQQTSSIPLRHPVCRTAASPKGLPRSSIIPTGCSARMTRPASLRFGQGIRDDQARDRPVFGPIRSPRLADDTLEFYSIKVPGGPLTEHLQKIRPGDTIGCGASLPARWFWTRCCRGATCGCSPPAPASRLCRSSVIRKAARNSKSRYQGCRRGRPYMRSAGTGGFDDLLSVNWLAVG